MQSTTRKPNELLRRQREQRGWTQERVADELYRLCGPNVRGRGDINANMISRWELGIHPPSLFYQEKLRILYGASPEELGFVEPLPSSESLPATTSSNAQLVSSAIPPLALQALDLLSEASERPIEELLGAWLALGAGDLAPLFASGWSLEEVLTSLHTVLPGVQAMSAFSRRKLFQLGAAAVISSIPLVEGKHISAEERINLHYALEESIAASWKLFHTAGSAQVLAVGHAQYYLVRQNHCWLYPSVQPLFYSAVYRLIGAAQHFQEHYEQAYRSQEQAYLAALEGADAWNMAQSRSWQAYGLKARGNYREALQTADAALRLISGQDNLESIRLRARLLAFTAENLALLHDGGEVQRRLDASQALLAYLPDPHEEFDRTSWLQQAGTCAVILKQDEIATPLLRQALAELPAQWTLRAVSTALPLATVLTRTGSVDEAVAVVRKTLPLLTSLQSKALIQQFQHYLHAELLARFPDDSRCTSFVGEVQEQLALT